jgi:site-specific DNA-adenine methylase
MVIKGPFSYSGNKYRIWNKYLKNTMKLYEKVHEPFVGSGVCMYNSNYGGNSIDIDLNVVALHNALKDPNLIHKVEECYNSYFKDSTDLKESFLKLRKDFNKLYNIKGCADSSNIHMLYVLIQLSFNSLLRFGPNGYNVPYGGKSFDLDRVKLHVNLVSNKDINVKHGTYRDLDLSLIDKSKDLIYFDPPYVASKFQYGGWNKENEIDLLDYIDELNKLGYSFILSNTFSHRGVYNEELIEWSKKYNSRLIEMSYNAWASRVSSVEREDNTVEVIITNIQFAFPDLPHAHQLQVNTNNLF